MKIDVTGVDAAIPEILLVKIERLVLLALSRFAPRIRQVTVRLAEPVNPLGGVDQHCRMRASLRDGGSVHSEALNGGFEAAVARTAALLAKRMDSVLVGGRSGGAASR